MKKVLIVLSIIFFSSIAPTQHASAQIPIVQIITAAVKKVIKAIDLKIQRLQNNTIWLQNAQKVLENEMSKLKLNEIGDWVAKQKQLYSNYFDELWKVKSIISSYQLVRNIIMRQVQMVQEYSKAFNLSRQDANFTTDELLYMQKVYTGILDESVKNIDQLQLAVNAFKTQMTDAQRMEIIHKASDNIDQNLSDLRQFNQQNIKISLQRSKDKADVDIVKKLYGLN